MPSNFEGVCEIELRLPAYLAGGYKLVFPEGWYVDVVGVESNNLLFNHGIPADIGWELFIHTQLAELPLNQAYKESYSYEMSGSIPLVASDEEVMEMELREIGNKDVLVLVTTLSDVEIHRYFFHHSYKGKTILHMYEFETHDSYGVGFEDFINIVEKMITSMVFLS